VEAYLGINGYLGSPVWKKEVFAVLRNRHKEENSLGWVTQKVGVLGREGSLRERGLSAAPSPLYAHKFEVSSCSRYRDARIITDRITGRLNDGTTDITTGLHIASFAYIGGQRHKKRDST